MRQAPPAGVSCSGGGLWRGAQVLLVALAAATFAAWVASVFTALAPLPPAAAAGLLAAALAWQLTPPRAAVLHWDGTRWTADGQPGDLRVMLDLGGWLLLRFAPATGRKRWLPLPQATQGMRAALYARGAAQDAQGG